MCENASWMENSETKEVIFLDDDDLNSKRGKELKEYLGIKYDEDKVGHGAIMFFYPATKGSGWEHKENIDFSDPKNFPSELVKKIKEGKRSQFGFCEYILNEKGLAEYKKIRGSAWAEYKKIKGSAWAEYKKIEGPALAEYEKIEGSALAEYKKIKGPAWAEYKKIEGPAWAEYKKIEGLALEKIIRQKKYRQKLWK